MFAIFGPLSWLYLLVFFMTDYDLYINVRRLWRLGGASKMGAVRCGGQIKDVEIRCINSIVVVGSSVRGLSEWLWQDPACV